MNVLGNASVWWAAEFAIGLKIPFEVHVLHLKYHYLLNTSNAIHSFNDEVNQIGSSTPLTTISTWTDMKPIYSNKKFFNAIKRLTTNNNYINPLKMDSANYKKVSLKVSFKRLNNQTVDSFGGQSISITLLSTLS